MRKLFIISLLVGFIGFISCGDDEPEAHETKYTVSIMSPDSSDKHVGDNIHIHVNFDEVHQGTVHHINVRITNKIDGSVLYSAPSESHVHELDGHYEHHDDVILNVDEHTDWFLEAKVWGHAEGVAEASQSVGFHVHP